MGIKVYGYDTNKNKFTKLCEEKGIKIVHKFDKELCEVDLCVKTGAIKSSKYLDYLKKINCPIVDRADLLAWLCEKFKNVIAVAGTHGKSTTSGLIYEILRLAKKKVSCHIGAEVFAPRFVLGDDYLVVEACEYNKSFLKLYPTVSVVTNVEKEHMECYKNLFNLQSSFLTFLKRGQTRIVFLDETTKFLQKYKHIQFVQKTDFEYNTKLKGEYNSKNISLAIKVCQALGIDNDIIKKGIQSFGGVPRRYDCIGKWNGEKVFIDYAHHPTEVKSFVQTFCAEFKKHQIIFQPHTYSRTKHFLNEFISAFKEVENLIIYKEYPAREKPCCGLSAKDLFLEICKANNKAVYCENFNTLKKALKEKCVLAFVGAGDINLVAEKIVGQKK